MAISYAEKALNAFYDGEVKTAGAYTTLFQGAKQMMDLKVIEAAIEDAETKFKQNHKSRQSAANDNLPRAWSAAKSTILWACREKNPTTGKFYLEEVESYKAIVSARAKHKALALAVTTTKEREQAKGREEIQKSVDKQIVKEIAGDMTVGSKLVFFAEFLASDACLQQAFEELYGEIVATLTDKAAQIQVAKMEAITTPVKESAAA